MPQPRKLTPRYLKHKRSGRARAIWTDSLGVRHERLLPGLFESAESLEAFARLSLEIATSPAVAMCPGPDITIAELLYAFLEHAKQHYRTIDGELSDEYRHLHIVAKHVDSLYSDLPAAEFGPLKLKAVRHKFVELGWARKTVNSRIERVRRIFRWGVAEELVSATVHHALGAVAGLKAGRTPARETQPVGPVEDAVVDATIPYLCSHVRGIVQFQRLTGCRPGEALPTRRCDIDMGGTVWLYKVRRHKSAHHGKARVIAIA